MTLKDLTNAIGGRRSAPPPAASETNRPEVVAEVRAIFEAYERALSANDAAPLDASFWEDAVRYGVVDIEYDAEVIAAWRAAAPPIPPGRTLGPTVICTFGTDFAHVGTEFRYPDSPETVGRQSQTWVRMEEGWRIVAAHVSVMPAELLKR